MRTLSAYRQIAPVPQSAIRLNIDQPLDVHRDFFAQVAFDLAFFLDDLTDTVDLVFAQILDLLERINLRGGQNPQRARIANPEYVSEPDACLFVARQIDSSNTRHVSSFADDPGCYASGAVCPSDFGGGRFWIVFPLKKNSGFIASLDFG